MKYGRKISLILCACLFLSATAQIFAQKAEPSLNKKPIEDFGSKYSNQILNRKIDIDAPFEIKVTAKLNEKGNLIESETTVKEGSDPKMTEFAKDGVFALSESGLLKTLYQLGGRNIDILFTQNEDVFSLILDTETESESKAKVIQSIMNIIRQNANFKKDSDDEFLMSKISSSFKGKNFIVTFTVPKDEKNALLERNLKILKERKNSNK